MKTKVTLAGMRRTELIDYAFDLEKKLDELTELSDAAGAVARVQKLAARFELDAAADTPASPVARAIAIEIRNALDL